MERLNFTEPLGDKPRITSKFGLRPNPFTGKDVRFHSGYDYSAVEGTAFSPLVNGKISSVNWTDYGGNTLTIAHEISINFKGQEKNTFYYSEYMHMQHKNNSTGVPWKVGDSIYTSDIAGYVGNTGRSTGSHLHAGVYLQQDNPLYNWLLSTDYSTFEGYRGLFLDYRGNK